MNAAILQNPFVTTALPIMFAIFMATWTNSKAFDAIGKRIEDLGGRIEQLKDDMNHRLEEIVKRLDRIEVKLEDHSERIVRLEAATSRVRI